MYVHTHVQVYYFPHVLHVLYARTRAHGSALELLYNEYKETYEYISAE